MSLFIHLILAVCGYLLAFYLRFSFKIDSSYWQVIIKTLPILVCIKLIIWGYFGLYSGLWEHYRKDDTWRILKAHVLATLCFISAVAFLCSRQPGSYTFAGFPRSIFILDFIISFCFL